MLDLLLITDLHYSTGPVPANCPHRRRHLGPWLIRKAFRRLAAEGIAPAAMIMLGDLLDDGTAATAEADLTELVKATREAAGELPVLVVPGNHDSGNERIAQAFDCPAGLHEIGGYGFIVFHDQVGAGDVTTRPTEALAGLQKAAAEHPGLPLIALQHNPLYPNIESGYPYMPSNTAEILAGYEKAGVFLSLSGHYHRGQAYAEHHGIGYYTAPTACESPFRLAHVRLDGRKAQIRELALGMEVPGLWDNHLHTEMAYCATTVRAREDITISRDMGLSGITFTEHAFQLYFEDQKEAWSYAWQNQPERVAEVLAGPCRKLEEYRRAAADWRSEFVRVGLEVDLCADGKLLLAEKHKAGWDLLVGAVHSLPDLAKDEPSAKKIELAFLQNTERLLAAGVQVLAHPFRCRSSCSARWPRCWPSPESRPRSTTIRTSPTSGSSGNAWLGRLRSA